MGAEQVHLHAQQVAIPAAVVDHGLHRGHACAHKLGEGRRSHAGDGTGAIGDVHHVHSGPVQRSGAFHGPSGVDAPGRIELHRHAELAPVQPLGEFGALGNGDGGFSGAQIADAPRVGFGHWHRGHRCLVDRRDGPQEHPHLADHARGRAAAAPDAVRTHEGKAAGMFSHVLRAREVQRAAVATLGQAGVRHGHDGLLGDRHDALDHLEHPPGAHRAVHAEASMFQPFITRVARSGLGPSSRLSSRPEAVG